MDDFHPEQVANQVEPIRKLVEARTKLFELLSKLDGNDKLDELLQDIIHNSEALKKLGEEVGGKSGDEPKAD